MITSSEIAHTRLHNQGIARAPFGQASDVVQWLGAVQSQDYRGALWAVGLRMNSASEQDVEQAFIDGAILRTHVMRPTWHFVTPADIRWLLMLTAPRVNAQMASYDRKLELDDALFARSAAALATALRGGNHRTRPELASVLQQAGIAIADPQRLGHLLMRAELDGLICSGGRRGTQLTYALLDERAPAMKTLARDEALAELTRRYFISHGPATLHDFVWWSGLTAADARNGLEMVKHDLTYDVIDGKSYWFAVAEPTASHPSRTAHILPNFDEYTVGYADRGAVFETPQSHDLGYGGNILFHHAIVIDGRVVGIWKRAFKKGSVVVAATFFSPPTDAETRAFTVAIERYSAFVQLPVVLQ